MDTLDVRGVPDKYIPWLQKMVEGFKAQPQAHSSEDKKIVFATHKSHLVGGYSRAAAYEE